MPARLTAYLPDAAASCLVRSLVPLAIGRGADSAFRINHPSVSRAHARLSWENGGWWLHDLGSKNGTFSGTGRVQSIDLSKGGWFRCGDVVCELALLSDQAADNAEGRMVDKRANSRFLIQAIDRQTSLPGMLSETVKATMELAECERGFLLLAGENGMTVAASHGLDPAALVSREFHGSVGAAQRVLETRAPVVVNDVRADPALGARASVIEGGLRTLVCLPLLAGEELLGLVYADSKRVGTVVTAMDLELLRAFADRAALWIAARQGIEALARLAPARNAWREIVEAQGLAPA